jgi:RNA-binding protein
MNNQQEKTLLSRERVGSLKKLAHHLRPVVQIGKNGVSEALLLEIEGALLAHELIKLQILPNQKKCGAAYLPEVLHKTKSHYINAIGNVAIIFRQREVNSQYNF